jgi:hypothetical protein
MFSLKKALLLATTALTVFAVAAPASAWATSEWSQEGQPLTSEATLGLEGTVSIRSGWSNALVRCTVNNSLKITPGSTGQLAESLIEPGTCSTVLEEEPSSGEELELCPGEAVEYVNWSNWSGVHLGNEAFWAGPALHWDNFAFNLRMNSNCSPFSSNSVEFEGGELTAEPDNTASINEFTLTGSVYGYFGTYEVWGHLNVTPAGTYGIS